MFPSGTIYNYKKNRTYGVTKISLPIFSRLFYKLVRGTGAGLTTASIILLLFSFGPIIQQEIDYRFNKLDEQNNFEAEMILNLTKADEIQKVHAQAANFGVNPYFSVVIPKINATSNIIANVDPVIKEEYVEALKQGVAHARGTYFPGQGKRILLFSHSTDSPLNIARYNAIFYLLRKLEAGDEIIVFFADQKYIYKVKDRHVTEPTDTSWLTDVGNSETLVLLTCDPPGTTWNRLIVEAVPVDKSLN